MEETEYRIMYDLEKEYWWWVGRRHIITEIIKKLNLNNIAILDVGCGTGINLGVLSNYGSVTGIDNSDIALSFCRERGFNNILNADVQNIPYENNKFDIISALDILEHVDDNQALSELHRILKPNGYLIITVPAYNFLWSGHDKLLHHKRRYVKSELIKLLSKNGFLVSKISYWNFFAFPVVSTIRFVKKALKIKQVKTDTALLPKFVNNMLISLLYIESWLLKRINLPFGVSLICLAKVKKCY